jgi:hypothetical protein
MSPSKLTRTFANNLTTYFLERRGRGNGCGKREKENTTKTLNSSTHRCGIAVDNGLLFSERHREERRGEKREEERGERAERRGEMRGGRGKEIPAGHTKPLGHSIAAHTFVVLLYAPGLHGTHKSKLARFLNV